jgi:hypothetical protein
MGRVAMATGAPRVGLTEGTRHAPDPAKVASAHGEAGPQAAPHGGGPAPGGGRPDSVEHAAGPHGGPGEGERAALERGEGRLPVSPGAYHPPGTGAPGAGAYHPPGLGAAGAYHPPGLGAAGVYHPPGMSALGAHPGGGFGGFQVPAARGMPAMRGAPAVHAAPSGGGGRRR